MSDQFCNTSIRALVLVEESVENQAICFCDNHIIKPDPVRAHFVSVIGIIFCHPVPVNLTIPEKYLLNWHIVSYIIGNKVVIAVFVKFIPSCYDPELNKTIFSRENQINPLLVIKCLFLKKVGSLKEKVAHFKIFPVVVPCHASERDLPEPRRVLMVVWLRHKDTFVGPIKSGDSKHRLIAIR